MIAAQCDRRTRRIQKEDRKMKIPGFTAQASLYKADHYRQVVASSARRLKGQVVVPQDYHQPDVINKRKDFRQLEEAFDRRDDLNSFYSGVALPTMKGE